MQRRRESPSYDPPRRARLVVASIEIWNIWVILYHDHANLRQRSPSYSPPRSSNRRSPSYEAPRRNSDRCCIASNQNFPFKCIGLDPGTRGAPGLLRLEAGKTMGGKNMRKILACLRLVERRSRRSIAGKDRIQSC